LGTVEEPTSVLWCGGFVVGGTWRPEVGVVEVGVRVMRVPRVELSMG